MCPDSLKCEAANRDKAGTMTCGAALGKVSADSAKDHAIADISKALADGWLQHRIAHRLPLDDIAPGNEIVERGGCRGAVVLEVD